MQRRIQTEGNYYDEDEEPVDLDALPEDEEDVDDIDVNNYKGIYYGDDGKKFQDEKSGAHFDFSDMCKRLNRIMKKRGPGLTKQKHNFINSGDNDDFEGLHDEGNDDNNFIYKTYTNGESQQQASKYTRGESNTKNRANNKENYEVFSDELVKALRASINQKQSDLKAIRSKSIDKATTRTKHFGVKSIDKLNVHNMERKTFDSMSTDNKKASSNRDTRISHVRSVNDDKKIPISNLKPVVGNGNATSGSSSRTTTFHKITGSFLRKKLELPTASRNANLNMLGSSIRKSIDKKSSTKLQVTGDDLRRTVNKTPTAKANGNKFFNNGIAAEEKKNISGSKSGINAKDFIKNLNKERNNLLNHLSSQNNDSNKTRGLGSKDFASIMTDLRKGSATKSRNMYDNKTTTLPTNLAAKKKTAAQMLESKYKNMNYQSGGSGANEFSIKIGGSKMSVGDRTKYSNLYKQ